LPRQSLFGPQAHSCSQPPLLEKIKKKSKQILSTKIRLRFLLLSDFFFSLLAIRKTTNFFIRKIVEQTLLSIDWKHRNFFFTETAGWEIAVI
jgi:hypothetical protein